MKRAALAVGLLLGLLLAMAVAALTAAFLLGATLDGARWRDRVAQQASAALGRPVVLRGALELTLGRELSLRVGELQLLNPPGFGAQPLLSVGEARVRVDTLEALRGRLRLRGLEARDVGLWLERLADGRGNWQFAASAEPAAAPPDIDLGTIRLSALALHYRDARRAEPQALHFESLEGRWGRQVPLSLELHGAAREGWPYRLQVDAGPWSELGDAGGPWRFKAQWLAHGGSARVQGTLDAGQGAARLRFEAQLDDAARSAARWGWVWPELGAAQLKGAAAVQADRIVLEDLQGSLGDTQFAGQLALALGDAQPRLSGALNAPVLDLRPWLESAPAAAGASAAADAGSPARLPAEWPLDLDLRLAVDHWLGLPVGLRDTTVHLQAHGPHLRAPLQAALAGAALHGQLDMDLAAGPPSLALKLTAQDLALGDLLDDLTETQGIDGRVQRAELRVQARGDSWAALQRQLQASLKLGPAQASYAQAAPAVPISLRIEQAQLIASPDAPLRLQARGALMDQALQLAVHSAPWPQVLQGFAVPIDAQLTLGRSRLRLQAQAPAAAAMRFEFDTPSSGELARWLPVAASSQLAVALRGRVQHAADAWQLDEATLQLGRSQLRVDARHDRGRGRPLTTATLRSALLDLPELSTLFERTPGTGQAAARLDAPLLASAIDLGDADLDIVVQRLWLGRGELNELSASARSRDGRLLPSTLKGRFGDTPFTAQAQFDGVGEKPAVRLELAAGAIDLGALLRTVGLAEDLEGQAQALQLTLQGQGRTLRELAAGTALDARVQGGRLRVLGPAQRPVTDIVLHEAQFGADAGQPLRLRLDGALDDTPLRLRLSTGSLADLAGDATQLPFALQAEAAGTRLALGGQAMLPLGSGAALKLKVSGERLDSLNELARVELPPWGPWAFSGPIRMSAGGYEIEGLAVQVGRSQLQGDASLDLSGPRPRLQVQVHSPTLQLDDFPSPQRLTDDAPPPAEAEGMRSAASRMAGRVDRMLSARFLRRFDATLDVQADEVLSGADHLANGALRLKLEQGRLHLDPALLNLPGGSMRLEMAYDLKESLVDFRVAARVERFDYGIIARRLQNGDALRGLFSMNMQIAGTAPSLDAVMRNARGRLDVAVWPTELSAGRFNLWSANLILTLLPLIDPGLKSHVNCIVGRFDLHDGNVDDDKFLIDTSAVRIRGVGRADLKTEELAFVFRPRAKGLGLFRVQTPLRVGGTLTDQRFYFDSQDVFWSTLAMLASPVLVPIEYLRLGPQARDGSDVCTDPLRTAGE